MTSAFFWLEAASPIIRRPMSDLKALEADLAEIEQRAATRAPKAQATQPVTVVLDAEGTWAKRGVKVPKASTPSLDVEEVWRKFNGRGPHPEKVMK